MSRRNRKRKTEEKEQRINDGEQDNFFSDEMKEEMKLMWEIPQIFHFFHLTRESLNIPQFSIYEMERMLLIPRASKQLANIMTCLLSSPITKAKLRKVPPMPYEFWTNILAHKMASWFKVYHAKHKDATKVLETIGIEPEFWNVFPDASLLDRRCFEDLSFKQRVWLLKTVCDTIMHTRKTVQEDIAKQPWEDQFETLLGVDRYGTRYIYFPQFIPNDFRIYRHCLNNKILSTVKPVKAKMVAGKLIGAKLSKYKQKKLQCHNNLSCRRSTRHSINNNDLNKYKSSNDSTDSFISEDTNLSNMSTCTNNNNISLNAINRKRCRSLSKMSEESTLSNARSSGYDTNTYSDKSVENESSSMFKGFVNNQNDNCGIGIINEMLDDLKSEINEEGKTNELVASNSSELSSQENLVKTLKNTIGSCEILVIEKDENERSSDNLSNSSKTDDEKLNDIISAENSKLPENVYAKSISASDNISDISILTSKSDDEKLSETKTSGSNVSMTFNDLFCASPSVHSVSLSEEITRCDFHSNKVKVSLIAETLDDSIERRNLRKSIRLRSRYKTRQHNKESKIEAVKDEVKKEKKLKADDKMDEADEKNLSASKLDLQDVEYDLDDYTNNCDTGYNLRRSKDPKTDECKKHFDKMLSDLGVSDFQLVIDTVEGLRDLISSFSANDSENNKTNWHLQREVTPLCEVTLVMKLTELLHFLEPMEAALKDTMRKARAKLQREWSNFKEGNVEDQDSSSEGGLSSNWWVLGSQGKDPLSVPGDATLQTLPQLTLSSLGTQNDQQQRRSNKGENTVENSEQSRRKSREASGDERRKGNGEKPSNVEASPTRRNQVEEGGEKREHNKKHGENESASNDKDAEQQTRRVLRTRGVSSYTEQLYSDDESDEDELEEWADVEAVYAAPGAQDDTSASHSSSKVRYSDDHSEEEDSDQDWILPGSRKRKNKRPSANRRLKSFQHKVQSITENTSQSNVASGIPHFANAKTGKDKLKNKLTNNREIREKTGNSRGRYNGGSNIIVSATNKVDPKRAVSSTNAVCKLESVESVHSELDIKDEGPIYESGTNHYGQSNYEPANPQQNYYYVMQQNPGIATGGSVISPLGTPMMQQNVIVQGVESPQVQNYYVQPGAQPSYVMQNSQTNFLPAAQQQPVFQQQGSQVIVTQPYVNNVSYVPYIVATSTQPQEYMIRPTTNQQNPPKPQNRSNQNRYMTTSRQSSQHPNSTMRANNRPVKDTCQRANSSKPTVPQRTSKTVPRRRAQQTSNTENSGQKTTSLIVLSDSDDEIEMIITEKTNTTEKETSSVQVQRDVNQSRQKPIITSDITVASGKGVISPQIIQRMSQGGISITPVKNTPPPSTTNTNTQLVVVVNETGSHYALALPNGSKLILTPEQVAQIRASNGGKLIL
ncbi:dentin sialophosphoprotein isoform X1 [Polyergus mexicanus]|uniref:dentin sialophosphoprotein isoform X1 n=1 Tax=Polyergus mexicanus TaxID=615972 RepID=UPI0038B5AA87